jgi:hypothetical protein
MNGSANRRERSRRACMLAVEYRAGSAGPWREASVLDLTLVGCRLRVEEELAPDAAVALRFAALLEDGVRSASLEAAATVQWCRGRAASRELGLRFVFVSAGLSEILAALDAP